MKALCLEPHDLILAKRVAGRERDSEFARTALAAGIVVVERLLGLVDDLPVDPLACDHVRAMLEGMPR